MSSFLPLDPEGFVGAAGGAAATGRVLAGGGGTRDVPLGLELVLAAGGAEADADGTGGGDEMLGSEPRPGGGGGFDALGALGVGSGPATEPDVVAGAAAFIDPDAGGRGGGALGLAAGIDGRDACAATSGGSGGGTDAGGAGIAPGSVGAEPGAGPGIPSSVRFMSFWGFVATCEPEPGGGGGAAAPLWLVGPLFFPRPSKMSRSDPPLFSSDIRVS